jgi:membrane protease YdiL (CAAX protease family)
MNAEGARPAPLLAAQAMAAFLLLALLPQLLWQLAQARGLVDSGLQERRETGALIFTITCAVVLAFALLLPPPVPWRPAAVRRVLAVYLPFLLGWSLFLVAYLRAMHWLGHAVEPQDLLCYFQDADPQRPASWLVAGMMVVLAPLAEEVVFRGYLQGALEAVFGVRVAWIAAAVAFGLVHGLLYALPIALLGLLLGWLRMRHRSLLAPFTAHAVHNGLVAAVTFAWPRSLDLLYPR